MICDIEDNSRRRLDSPIPVTCRRCGAQYMVRLFPLRAECGMGDVAEFLEAYDKATTVGLGDVAASVIQTVTLGMVKPSADCGCEGRKQMLNNWWSWRASR